MMYLTAAEEMERFPENNFNINIVFKRSARVQETLA